MSVADDRAARIHVLGSGALAREIVLALPAVFAQYGSGRLHVTIGSRDQDRADWLAVLGRARAHAAGAAVEFGSVSLDWADEARMAELFARGQPDVVLNTASLQSAWSLSLPNPWSALVRAGGYAVTVALQAALLPALSRSLAASGHRTLVVNACYPDVVNAVASHFGLSIVCGIGNIALVVELVRQRLSSPPGERLRVVAGHWDVDELIRPPAMRRDTPLAWQGTCPVEPATLADLGNLSGDATMNALSASESARLLVALCSQGEHRGLHVPGPLGEMGGYPVRLKEGHLAIDLPASVELTTIRAWNHDRCSRDGAIVTPEGQLKFSGRAARAIARSAAHLASGFAFSDVTAAAEEFVDLRRSLGGG